MTVSSPARTKTALCLILGFAGCAPLPVAGDAGFRWVEVNDDIVTISIDDEHGIPMEEFIRAGQFVTGKVLTYSRAEVGDVEHRIRLTGKVLIEAEKFFAFFETMLYVNGFDCVPSARGDAEIIVIKRRHDGRGRRQCHYRAGHARTHRV